MTIDLRLPAPTRKELLAIGGAAALAVAGVVEGPAALLLAAVPLVRSHLTAERHGHQGVLRATVGVEAGSNGTARRRRSTTTRRSTATRSGGSRARSTRATRRGGAAAAR